MDLRKLEYFIACVDYKSFTQAAIHCNISQTGISQQIRALEDELGIVLFDRSGYRARLTLEGKKFYRRCKHILDDYNRAIIEIQNINKKYTYKIKLGLSEEMKNSYIYKFLQTYIKKNPDVNIEIKEDKPNAIIKNYTDEFHVILGNLVELSKLAEFEIAKTIECNMVAITSNDHYLNDVDEIEGIALASEEIVIFSKEYSMFYHEEIIKNFEIDGFKPNIVHIADSFSELILMVFLNKGIAVLPKESLSKTNLENINFVNIKNTNHKYKYSAAINKKYMNSEINDFVDGMMNEFYEYHNS
ncbi:LysR family transcriptional regulator [Terrisporobacter mayombei]|uniref:HTH-type transcriptional regulator CynR n=1 Tax=Terrisporobacter mayombei TaxID=1541 RepID=A0ABY9Q4M1_9FIRM|nr:LysR family transcriptional regulator [Terrisporobacter mayombei]MCC3869364.1 LysR family transcriptional regulator [Terrisporobacter mayombei]WMT82194.1 HTH-type transcriptional regulator CynR [Terrisporobacter mayombei]